MRIKGKHIFGLILILVGFILLGQSLDLFYISLGDFFSGLFPFLLIGLGIWMIVKRRNKDREIEIDIHAQKFDKFSEKMNDFSEKVDEFSRKTEEKFNQDFSSIDPKKFAEQQSQTDKQSDSEQNSHDYSKQNGKIKYDKFLGDMFIDCAGINMQNVEVSMGIGEVEMKLHNGKFEEGLNRLIISCFIGDIRIYVPQSLEVFANCSNFIGDIEAVGKRTSGFGNNVESQTMNYDQATTKLYIACNNFIGDIKIHII